MLQFIADRNRKQLENLHIPLFVSTPDLLDDLPQAHWCPLVVDPIFLGAIHRPLLAEIRPVVTHIPSRGWLKGTELIQPIAEELASKGLIEYQPLTNVPKASMPQNIGAADILLEQFRIGNYSATAVEAMAMGRVVVGHVLPRVREYVFRVTGREVPILEASPDSLKDVLQELISNPERMHELGAQGQDFVSAVHDGRLSAMSLSQNWLEMD
jgi:glycosyltransferase involved in cell wall biosynthesis